MNERKAIFLISVLKNIIDVYFDTFFVMYFFQIANYEIVPLAKYYITLYMFIGIGFVFIRKSIKKNIIVPYLRLGISMQALYIALIMLLKENIINYILIVGILKGVADGLYYFPKNILYSDKISNEDRQRFHGLVNTINKIIAILMPLLLGVLLSFMSYTDLGKIFFMLFIFMFLITFWLKDNKYGDKKFEMKKFVSLVKTNKNIVYSLLIPLLSGLTYSSGVMSLVVTLFKINVFKTNLNLGFVDSITAILSLIVCILYSTKIKEKSFKRISYISGFISFSVLVLFAFFPKVEMLIIFLLIRYSFILIISLISEYVTVNLANCEELKMELKPEYFLARDVLFSISRTIGYIIIFLVVLFVGMDYINYILIIAGFSLFIEAILVGNLSKLKK